MSDNLLSQEQEEEEAQGGKEGALDLLHAQLERVNAELGDINQKLDQSRMQVEQMAKRNAALIGEVKRVENALDQTPRLTIKDVYSEALNSQQRLLTTRGQMEKLQTQAAAVQREAETIKGAIELLQASEESGEGKPDTLSARETIIRVIDAQEVERERLAKQMHDGPAQSLTNFILQAEICEKLFERDHHKTREELTNLKTSAGEVFKRVRSFIFELRPMMLTDLGLVPTLKRYLDAFSDKTNVATEFIMMGRERRLESYREVLVFRGIQELMANARDHGGATLIKVTIEIGDEETRAVVEDNGRGFETGKLALDAEEGNFGLRTLRERLALVNGNLQIDSTAGQGAKVQITIPSGPEPDEVSEYHGIG
jgi:two-component system sensor histidine kinase DegS